MPVNRPGPHTSLHLRVGFGLAAALAVALLLPLLDSERLTFLAQLPLIELNLLLLAVAFAWLVRFVLLPQLRGWLNERNGWPAERSSRWR